MLLIIGGASSGKRTYARCLGYAASDMADAVLDQRPVVFNVQDLVAADPEHCEQLLPQLLQKEVVICNEVGSGVIPAEYQARRSREATGRLCIKLAQQASQVVRLVCGLPVVIKGGD